MNRRTLTALPIYNEEQHIPEVLPEVIRYSDDVLVVNDGSKDGTAGVLETFPNVTTLTHETNRGYGAALRTAFEYARQEGYDALVTIDCDGQHEPCRIPQLVERLFADESHVDEGWLGSTREERDSPKRRDRVAPSNVEGATDWGRADDVTSSPQHLLRPDPSHPADGVPVDLVSGSRYLKTFDGDSVPPGDRRRINMRITAILNDLFGLGLTDSFCGFKAYRVASLGAFDVTELGYAMPLQHWIQAVAAGLKIVEFPVPLVYLEEERSFGCSLDDAEERMRYYLEVLSRELCEHHLTIPDELREMAPCC